MDLWRTRMNGPVVGGNVKGSLWQIDNNTGSNRAGVIDHHGHTVTACAAVCAVSATITVGTVTGNGQVPALIVPDIRPDRSIMGLMGGAPGSLVVTVRRLGQVDVWNRIGERSDQERHQYECMNQSVEDVSHHERIRTETVTGVQVRVCPSHVVETRSHTLWNLPNSGSKLDYLSQTKILHQWMERKV